MIRIACFFTVLFLLSGTLFAQDKIRMFPEGVLGVRLSASAKESDAYMDGVDTISYGEKLLEDRKAEGKDSGTAEIQEQYSEISLQYGFLESLAIELSARNHSISRKSDVRFEDVSSDDYDEALLQEIASDSDSSGLERYQIRLIHSFYKDYNFEFLYSLGYVYAQEDFDNKEFTNYLRHSAGGERYSVAAQMNFYNIIYEFSYGFSLEILSQANVKAKTRNEETIQYTFAPEIFLRGFIEIPNQNFDYGLYLEHFSRNTERFGKRILNSPSSSETLGGYLKFHNLDGLQPDDFPYEIKLSFQKVVYGTAEENDFGFGIDFQTYVGF